MRRSSSRILWADMQLIHRRAGAVLAGLALALIAAGSALTGTASAAIPSLQYVGGSSGPPDSRASRLARAFCPPGTRALGGGANLGLGGGVGQVGMSNFGISEFGNSFDAVAEEDQDGFAGNWGLNVTAACASRFDIQGYELVHQISEPPNSSEKAIIASCPSGKQVLGADARVIPDSSSLLPELVLDGVIPSTDLTSVRAEAFEDQDGTGGNWRLQVTAVCAIPPARLELSTGGGEPSSSNKSAVAGCSSGKKVLSAGGNISGGRGQVRLGELSAPPGGDIVIADAHEDQDGTTGDWSLRAYAICALP